MLIQANAVHIPLADKSVQLCCFSPPYWGLRKYSVKPMIWGGVDANCQHEWQTVKKPATSGAKHSSTLEGGKTNMYESATHNSQRSQFCLHCNAWKGDLGLEPTPELYLAHMMMVMAEVERVLRDDGVCFVNIADTYHGGGGGNYGKGLSVSTGANLHLTNVRNRIQLNTIKPKSLCLIPQKFAIKCQEMGWIIRSEVIWAKKNCMPESCKDRPTRSHEQVWMMTKSNKTLLWKHRDGRWVYQKPKPDYIWIHKETEEEQKEPPPKIEIKKWKRKNLWAGYSYYWDQGAVREEASPVSIARIQQPNFQNQTGGPKDYKKTGINPNRSMRQTLENFAKNPGRNIRDVWTIATEPTPEAHFATWPSKLVERMIRVATKPGDIVFDPFCGTAKTVIEVERLNRVGIGLDLSWEYLADIALPRLERPLQRELVAG